MNKKTLKIHKTVLLRLYLYYFCIFFEYVKATSNYSHSSTIFVKIAQNPMIDSVLSLFLRVFYPYYRGYFLFAKFLLSICYHDNIDLRTLFFTEKMTISKISAQKIIFGGVLVAPTILQSIFQAGNRAHVYTVGTTVGKRYRSRDNHQE